MALTGGHGLAYDFCVVGGGIVGLATAHHILMARPQASLLLVEKMPGPGQHQTGHNSGVIHAGIYYPPQSLKARLCRAGLEQTKQFCTEHAIAFDECGKLIVATDEKEARRLEVLHDRATRNDLALERLSGDELREREPNIVGKSALFSPLTGIVDFGLIAQKLAELLEKSGARIAYGTEVDRLVEHASEVEIGAGGETHFARRLVVCAGLQSDRLARLAGLDVDYRIVPFRGEYFRLRAEKSDLVRHLIYPAPDPSMPFLGIHLTRMIGGGISVGPNAVLGWAREGYKKFSFSARDAADIVSFPGFWKLIAGNLPYAAGELRNSLSKRAYLKACRKYCPSLELDDLQPYRDGIRAQAVNRRGEALHDFMFAETDRMLHVCNAPSPAATSALPIGAMIAEKCLGETAGQHA